MTNFVRIGVGTLAILAIPFLAMQFTNEVNWDQTDFIVMGVLLFVTGSLINFALTKFGKYKLAAAGLIVFLFLWLWAELAVGIFTNWGS